MLLDWSPVVIFNDLLDCIIQFSLPLSGHFILSLLIGGVIIYFAWRSTDLPSPDLPSPPRPPYVIQIHANVNGSNGVNGVTGRQNLSDVRLLNILPHRHHQTQHHQHQHGRHGTLFLGLLRRPQSRPLLPLPIPPTIRSRFQAPNLIVYHQVNVYHHTHGTHPHSSLPRNGNGAINNNQASQHVTTATSSSSSSSSDTLNVPRNLNSSNAALPSDISSSNRSVESQQQNNNNNTVQQSSCSSNSVTVNPVNLNSNRRSLSENNIADIETEESTVDVVEVEVDELNVSDTTASQVGVDVNLSGSGVTIVGSSSSTSASVQLLDGLNLNVNSNLVTMNSTNELHNNTATTSGSSSIPSADSSVKNVEASQGPKKTQDDTTGTSSTSSSATKIPNDSVDSSTSSGNDGEVRVTLKFLNDTQMEVTTQLNEKIVDFKRRHFAVELNDNKIVRLIFNGRVLDNDGRTLQESGIFDQCVVHCLIVTPQNSAQQRGQGGSQTSHQLGRTLREGPEPGMFFVSVLGIILIFMWFVCYQFGQQLFTQGAVVSLIVLTALFFVVVLR